jgi:transcriptional regulator with XRE-family HTH domain
VSQSRLAQRIGLSRTYMCRIETGRESPPSADRVEQIASELGYPADDLLMRAGKPPRELAEMWLRSRAGREFFRTAQRMKLSEDDWLWLTARIKERRTGRDSEQG